MNAANIDHMIETFAAVIEYRSPDSMTHILRIKEFTRILTGFLANVPEFEAELNEVDRDAIIRASVLHDVGKIEVPDRILLKPGRLTPDEFETIRCHSDKGAHIVEALGSVDEPYFRHSRDICRHHHEHWDGTGYPSKLKGRDIPLSARIVALADVYDALVSARCYKREFTFDETLSIIKDASGTQFQPEIVNALLETQALFEVVVNKTKDE